jgi:hypothetical protein
VDAFRPIDPAAHDDREYGVTSDDGNGGRRDARELQDGLELQDGRRRGRGLLAGGTAGFLAAALALGVANLVAAFVRPQASPIIAVGGAFVDRTPSWLKNFAVEKFGENDKNVLLLGLYVTIAVIAILIGMIAWRRVWAGVVGIGAFGAIGAYIAYTRPDSHVTDVIPSLAGGIAGIVAIALLVRVTRRRASAAEAFRESRLTTVRSGEPGWVA